MSIQYQYLPGTSSGLQYRVLLRHYQYEFMISVDQIFAIIIIIGAPTLSCLLYAAKPTLQAGWHPESQIGCDLRPRVITDYSTSTIIVYFYYYYSYYKKIGQAVVLQYQYFVLEHRLTTPFRRKGAGSKDVELIRSHLISRFNQYNFSTNKVVTGKTPKKEQNIS